MLVSALLEDVAMLHNLNAILSVPRIGPQRTRLVAFRPTLVSGGVGSVRSADGGIFICDCAAGSQRAREGRY